MGLGVAQTALAGLGKPPPTTPAMAAPVEKLASDWQKNADLPTITGDLLDAVKTNGAELFRQMDPQTQFAAQMVFDPINFLPVIGGVRSAGKVPGGQTGRRGHDRGTRLRDRGRGAEGPQLLPVPRKRVEVLKTTFVNVANNVIKQGDTFEDSARIAREIITGPGDNAVAADALSHAQGLPTLYGRAADAPPARRWRADHRADGEARHRRPRRVRDGGGCSTR